MKAPIDKVRAGGNDIIQVIVTRMCDILTCSNCTQLLPYRTDVKSMSLDVFRQAVRSLRGWPGVIALFGGNPVMHPQFAEVCAILCEEVPNQRQRGLWTNHLISPRLGAIAKETFWPHGRFNLNVHGSPSAVKLMEAWLPGIQILGAARPSWHAPILMDWHDLGLTPEQWAAAREDCDVNRNWSGAIAERQGQARGYFCEIAAAFDGVRGEDHGVAAVAGWWQQGMRAFAHQVTQCCDRGCGVPLRFKGHLDMDETYDCTKGFAVATRTSLSRAVQRVVHVTPPERTRETTDYQRIRE